jgi:DNA repair protein RadC
VRDQRPEVPLKLDGLSAARRFFERCFADTDATREWLWVAHVDQKGHCLHLSRHRGNETGIELPLKAILSDVLEHGSSGILLAHNHPSGDARPSDSDCRATRRLATVAEALDCTILDHLLFAGETCTSLRKMGLL